MAARSIKLSPDIASFAAFEECMDALSELAERLPKVRKLLLRLLDRPADIVRFEYHPAPSAGKGFISLEPSNALHIFAAALRATDRHFEIVEKTSHGWPIL